MALERVRRGDEEVAVYRGTDRVCFAAGGGWYAGSRRVSWHGDFGSNVLCVEEEVRQHGRERVAQAAAAGRREWTAETAGRGSDARQTYSPRGNCKKAL